MPADRATDTAEQHPAGTPIFDSLQAELGLRWPEPIVVDRPTGTEGREVGRFEPPAASAADAAEAVNANPPPDDRA